jgi:hypothetical protein
MKDISQDEDEHLLVTSFEKCKLSILNQLTLTPSQDPTSMIKRSYERKHT